MLRPRNSVNQRSYGADPAETLRAEKSYSYGNSISKN